MSGGRSTMSSLALPCASELSDKDFLDVTSDAGCVEFIIRTTSTTSVSHMLDEQHARELFSWLGV